MTGRRLFGTETEYAVVGLAPDGSVLPTEEVAGGLMRAIPRLVPHLRSPSGWFLSNGSRAYVDAGAHPELAGPEVLDPSDAVRFARANDRLILKAAAEVLRRNPSVITTLRVLTGNVDYQSRTTWGAHESYAHRADPSRLRHLLIPHLVSRVIYAGAGGFNPLVPGLEFCLSPRAFHMCHVMSGDSTQSRGIVDLRDESLDRAGYGRQHLLCGENLRSDLAVWLKVGTTALMVAIVEGAPTGTVAGRMPELSSPLEALKTLSRDPTCTARVPTTRGLQSALDVQRTCLDLARAHLGEPFMPPWAGEVCDRWATVLARLAAGADRVSATLDWAIKLRIYRDHAERRGLSWLDINRWSRVVDYIGPVQGAGGQRPSGLTAATIAEATGTFRERVKHVAPYVRQCRLLWDGLDHFMRVRDELLALDVRWGELGPNGLFSALDEEGVLDHRLPGVDRIDIAIAEPPARGRAHLRGETIRRLARHQTKVTCDWDRVVDDHAKQWLDLGDPFADAVEWRAFGPAPAEASAPPQAMAGTGSTVGFNGQRSRWSSE